MTDSSPSKQCAECARYESGREVLTLLIDTQNDKIRELEEANSQLMQDLLKGSIRIAEAEKRAGSPPPAPRITFPDDMTMAESHGDPRITGEPDCWDANGSPVEKSDSCPGCGWKKDHAIECPEWRPPHETKESQP